MISKLKKYFKEYDAILISSIQNIKHITNFEGFSEVERECFLIITKNKNYLITDERYSEAVVKQVKDFKIINIGAGKFIQDDFENILKNFKNKKIGIEKNNLTVSEFESLKKVIKNIKDLNLEDLRSIKNINEIQNLKKACKITDDAFEFILKKIKLGITEKEIAEKLELFFRSQKVESSFKPIVAFGTHSSIPHHTPSNTRLKKNQIVLLDFGVKVNGYCSDMSRTIFFGKADSRFKKIYQTVLESQVKAIEKIRTGIKASEIDKEARNHITKNGFPNIIHALGHGVGLEVHEFPTLSPGSKDIIKNKMIFSIEPGIYITGYGGVRIEDLVLVRSGKAELISKSKREIISLNAK